MKKRVLLIDNYDSFTYNLAQYLEELGADVLVHRNDEIDVEGIRLASPTHIVISPGPGTPDDSGISLSVVSELCGDFPILGVCLGHQVIAQVTGGRVIRGPAPVHGKTSLVHHDGKTIFKGIESPITATRYHSLIVDRESLPPALEVSCESDDGLIMGIRHREYTLEGVQFHPESILTKEGHRILDNFLNLQLTGGINLDKNNRNA